MKQTLITLLAAALLLLGCTGPKNVSPQDAVDGLRLKDYDPVTVFKVEEHHPAAYGEEFDRLYDLFTGISDKFELWCGFDMTKWDQPEFPACAVAELERCHAKGAGGVGEHIDKGMGEKISRNVREPGLHFNDPKFDALFEKCAELGMPVSIHSGDPVLRKIYHDNAVRLLSSRRR